MRLRRYLYYMLNFLYIIFNIGKSPDDFSLMLRNLESGSDQATGIRYLFSRRNYNNEFSALSFFRVHS